MMGPQLWKSWFMALLFWSSIFTHASGFSEAQNNTFTSSKPIPLVFYDGWTFYKVATADTSDTGVAAACLHAGLLIPCTGGPGCTRNDVRECSYTPEKGCHNPMTTTAKHLPDGGTCGLPSCARALVNTYAYMGHHFNGGSACGGGPDYCKYGSRSVSGYAFCAAPGNGFTTTTSFTTTTTTTTSTTTTASTTTTKDGHECKLAKYSEDVVRAKLREAEYKTKYACTSEDLQEFLSFTVTSTEQPTVTITTLLAAVACALAVGSVVTWFFMTWQRHRTVQQENMREPFLGEE